MQHHVRTQCVRAIFAAIAVMAAFVGSMACGASGKHPAARQALPSAATANVAAAPPASGVEQPGAASGANAASSPTRRNPAAESPPSGAVVAIPVPTAVSAGRAGSSGARASSGHSAAPDDNPNPANADDTANDAGVTAGGIVALATPNIGIPGNETVAAIPTPTATAVPSGGPTLAGCSMFPANNAWNQDISTMAVDPNSANYITRINQSGNGFLHADFGGNGAYGIPYIVVPQSQPMTAINYTDYGDESDPGPFPIPLNAPIEGGASSSGDRHVLAIQQGTCRLYELFNAYPQANRWDASSGATFDLSSNALRPQTWTSADAAGLPILPGLVRYDEVQAGEIKHAVRFTVGTVRKAWVDPATHYGTSTDPLRIPYGAKLRLKANYDISGYAGQSRVILNAMKKYGMIVADQGTSWYVTGAADTRWDDDDLNQLKSVPGSAFEVVQLGAIHTYP